MKNTDEIERLLQQTPTPCVVEGPHREQLKKRLLMEPQSRLQDDKKMRMSVFARMSPALRVAAVILAAVLLVGAGWAAEKIYEKLKFTQASLTLEEHPHQEWTLPNGKKLTVSGTTGTVVNPDDAKAAEIARLNYEKMKELVAQKRYKLLKTFEDASTGGTEHVYQFTFSDGTQDKMNFSMPLDNVASWDDYQRKKQEQTQHYRDQVNMAIAAGRYRLINQDITLLHICIDRESHKKVRVQRISMPKGEEIALYRPYDLTEENQTTTVPQSTWREHLQAIREGKLELLDVETMPDYTYEVIFEDGTKQIFWYGGGEPLKRSKAK
jgi:hypothetical protein